MIALNLSNDVIIPSGVAIVGALVAGISAILRSWIENRDARTRGDRKLDLAMKRTEFAREWITIGQQLDDDGPNAGDTGPNIDDPRPESKAGLIEHARSELYEAARETQIAFYDATTDTSTGLGQLRRLLMLTRRRTLASYVVSGLFLYSTIFVWLIVCIPTPGDDGFSIVAAIFISIVATFVLRVLAGSVVGGLERRAISDAERITDVAVNDNVVTITTKAPHGFETGQTVTIDASDDRFDGTFDDVGVPVVENVPDENGVFGANTFTFELRSANAQSLPGVTGWVCGDSVKEQMRRLFMINHRTRRPARLASGLFLLSIVAMSTTAVVVADNLYDRGDYPRCIGDPYDGTYYGVDDHLFDVSAAEDLIQVTAPVWSDYWLTFSIKKSEQNTTNTYFDSDYLQKTGPGEQDDSPSWTLWDTNDQKYFLDDRGLRYYDKNTVLYRRFGDSGLRPIGKPCAPQSLQVSITQATILGFDDNQYVVPGRYEVDDQNTTVFFPREWRPGEEELYEMSLFEYYDDSSRTGVSWISLPTAGAPGKTNTIDAYFGRDGRLIPVCNDVNYPEISPCLDKSDAYHDSGLDRAVTLAFWTGLVILVGTIVSRLLFGWIANRFDPPSPKEPKQSAVTV